MAQEIIVITAATGNIGSKLGDELLKRGKKIRVVGRDANKLEGFKQKGAEVAAGNAEDAEFITKAFEGAQAVFALIPPNYAAQQMRAFQNKIGEIYAKGIERAGVKYVVNLSSVGAHLSEKVGPISGLYDQEQRLNRIKFLNVVHLRPGFFMENTLMNIGLIKQAGINGSPMKSDLSFSMIATQDIANAAADFLAKLDWKGKFARELLGQRDLTMQEVTQVLSKSIHKGDLKYVQFPYEDTEKALLGMGMSQDAAQGMVEMYRAFNDGILRPVEARSGVNTTATSIEKFAETVFAKVYLN